MHHNFDKITDRQNTDSLKWHKYAGKDIIPMWVADMDFPSPGPVIEALHKRIDHKIFGYAAAPKELIDTIVSRMQEKYRWCISPEWIVWLPGLVPALHLTCQSAAAPDDEIITFTPVYPPFFTASMPTQKLKTIPLSRKDGRYTFDLEKFKAEITPKTKLLMLCNPHNPAGRSYDRQELKEVIDICLEHNIMISSDEIHCDLILDNTKHIPTAMVIPEAESKTITLMSPSKTFNLPGLNCSFAVIANGNLRKSFINRRRGIIPDVNALGYTACQAAYTQGQKWLDDLLEYLKTNRDILEKFIKEQTPQLSMDHMEATYLAWINTSGLNTENPTELFEQAGVGPSPGIDFGSPNHIRLNIATQKQTLLKALERIKSAIQ